MRWRAILGFRLVCRDPVQMAAFYTAIGFGAAAPEAIPDDELRLLGVRGPGVRVTLRLGSGRVDLDGYGEPGRDYPAGARATNTLFQHLALVTRDADAAWRRAHAAGAEEIGRDGPVTLPASSGGVRAIKFRDPEGHPLEFLQFPSGAARSDGGATGIDHSAIVVADAARSRAFYAAHGLRVGTSTVNRGPAQDALDGSEGVVADVIAMMPEAAAPHVELLGYRAPRPVAGDPPAIADRAATRIVWAADRDAVLRDPDGHLHQLVATPDG